MTQATDEGILSRIRKCLKLADKKNGATEAEAAAAMAMARKLMDKHNLSMSDVEIKEELDSGAKEVEVGGQKAYTALWEKHLARVCDHLFECRHYYSVRPGDGWTGKKIAIAFIGVGQDPFIAKEAYTILLGVVRKMGSSKGYTGAALRDYCLGVVTTLINRAYEIAAESKRQQETKCRDLVVAKGAIIKSAMEDLGLTKSRAATARMGPEFMRGAIDGRNVDLSFRKALK